MNFGTKVVGKLLSCQHCHAKLRLRFVPTAALAILVYVAILFIGVSFGVNGTSILAAFSCLLAFLAACLSMPLEVITEDQDS